MNGRMIQTLIVVTAASLAVAVLLSTGSQGAGKQGSSPSAAHHRRLLASSGCGSNCQNCSNAGTGTGAQCQQCFNNLVVLRSLPVNDPAYMSCGCQAGFYLAGSGAQARCLPCDKGYFCTGALAPRQPCPDNMDTPANKAKKAIACLEKAGYAYVPASGAGGSPNATLCADNSYNPGMKKALSCRKCTAGFVIQNNTAIRDRPELCVTPPGSYVNRAGAAAKCPRGEWKDGWNLDARCTKCAAGITTVATSSTSLAACKVVKAGFTGRLDGVAGGVNPLSIKPCPQSHWCNETVLTTQGSVAAHPCGQGLWTKEMGAKSPIECMVPPGYKLAAGDTTKCEPNTFRSGWAAANDAAAAACTPCGDGISADSTQTPLAVFDESGGVSYEGVAGSEEACYIEPGWGMWRVGTGAVTAWMARSCAADTEYGNPDRLYGLAPAPCRTCPFNMITTAAPAELRVAGLAISPDACLTQPGMGYENRMAEPCRAGTYNEGGNREPCTECPAGMTTTVASGATSLNNCSADAGNEVVDGVARECLKGFYHDQGAAGPCQACDEGFTTETTGAASNNTCSLCIAGHGGSGCTACTSGTFATADNQQAPCTPCPASTDFVFQFPGVSEDDLIYTAPTVSIAAAPSRAHCTAAFMQLSNAAPLITATGGMTVEGAAGNLTACVSACTTKSCQFLSFSYADATCQLRVGTPGKKLDNTYCMLAFKQSNAGNAGANSLTKSVGSGAFSYYEDVACEEVDGYSPAAAGTSQAACLSACTSDEACAAVRIALDDSRNFSSCGFIRPAAVPNGQVRSLIRADMAATSLPGSSIGGGQVPMDGTTTSAGAIVVEIDYQMHLSRDGGASWVSPMPSNQSGLKLRAMSRNGDVIVEMGPWSVLYVLKNGVVTHHNASAVSCHDLTENPNSLPYVDQVVISADGSTVAVTVGALGAGPARGCIWVYKTATASNPSGTWRRLVGGPDGNFTNVGIWTGSYYGEDFLAISDNGQNLVVKLEWMADNNFHPRFYSVDTATDTWVQHTESGTPTAHPSTNGQVACLSADCSKFLHFAPGDPDHQIVMYDASGWSWPFDIPPSMYNAFGEFTSSPPNSFARFGVSGDFSKVIWRVGNAWELIVLDVATGQWSEKVPPVLVNADGSPGNTRLQWGVDSMVRPSAGPDGSVFYHSACGDFPEGYKCFAFKIPFSTLQPQLLWPSSGRHVAVLAS